MTSEETQGQKPKRKRRKWWLISLIVFGVLMIIGSFSDTSTTSTDPNTVVEETTTEPATSAVFEGEITRWEPLNPASGRAVFTIRNVGDAAGVPGDCTVKVQDASGTYRGFDFITLENEIQPGAKFMGNVVLTVTKEGAQFVTQGSIECD